MPWEQNKRGKWQWRKRGFLDADGPEPRSERQVQFRVDQATYVQLCKTKAMLSKSAAYRDATHGEILKIALDALAKQWPDMHDPPILTDEKP